MIDQETILAWAAEHAEAFQLGFIDSANRVKYSPFNACAYTAGYMEAANIFHLNTKFRYELLEKHPDLGIQRELEFVTQP